MVYQYRVHKKVKFSRKDRINAGADPVREKINEVITWIFVIIMVICAIYLIIVVPVVISLELGEWRFFVCSFVYAAFYESSGKKCNTYFE